MCHARQLLARVDPTLITSRPHRLFYYTYLSISQPIDTVSILAGYAEASSHEALRSRRLWMMLNFAWSQAEYATHHIEL
jgi:hypothetical protein